MYVIIKELLENDKTLSERMPLSPKNVLDLLGFLVRTTFFIFNGTYYQQTEGVAVGGPPSSIVAEIYMQATEMTALTTTSHPPKVWECHVDDVFTIIRNSNLHDFFQHINSLHPKTKFTMETEQGRNSGNTISVRVYRKPTHTDQYLKFTSHHLARTKKSVITSLFDRAKNIISNPSTKRKKKIISQQYSKLMVMQRNSSAAQLEHHNYQDNQQIMTIPKPNKQYQYESTFHT